MPCPRLLELGLDACNGPGDRPLAGGCAAGRDQALAADGIVKKREHRLLPRLRVEGCDEGPGRPTLDHLRGAAHVVPDREAARRHGLDEHERPALAG